MDPIAKATPEVLEALREAFPEEWREEPLGWERLLVWEAEHRVTLPEPYRSLIAEVANGSSLGPPEDGGLLPLGWLPSTWRDEDAPRDPSVPFPLTRGWYWEEDDRPGGEISPLIEAVYRHGSVPLGTESVDNEWILITAGPYRGSVWILADVGAFPYVGPDVSPLKAEGPGMGLLDWINQWRTGLGWFDLT
jgi:hypothetical protein